MTRILLVAAMAMSLAACSSGGGASTASAPPRMSSGQVLLQQVRSAGTMGNELDVQPLRDPQVEDLRSEAAAAEARADWGAASLALEKALLLSPDDPDQLQWRAEIARVGHDFARAHQLATRSWERGPKLGGLCRRNWTTMRFAAEARADAAAAAQAQQHAAACAVAPPTRY
jgi:hypothetical protein